VCVSLVLGLWPLQGTIFTALFGLFVLSQGFKRRTNRTDSNQSYQTIIMMACFKTKNSNNSRKKDEKLQPLEASTGSTGTTAAWPLTHHCCASAKAVGQFREFSSRSRIPILERVVFQNFAIQAFSMDSRLVNHAFRAAECSGALLVCIHQPKRVR
jgi:hypothetical protein